MGYTRAQTGPDTHNTIKQEEQSITLGYTSAQTGPHTDTHNTTGNTAHHYGIHWRIDGKTYRHTQHNTTGKTAHHYGIH
jgi:hypothetical protein